jgi:hypothetical protein
MTFNFISPLEMRLKILLKLPLTVALVITSTMWLGSAHAQNARHALPQAQPSLSSEVAAPSNPLPGSVRTISWEQLMPPGWDPYKDLKALNLESLKDNDPRAEEVLKKMRQMWDNAPINPQVLGQNVRLPGFMVPLEELPEGSKEFLLVPYFGACVHSPPPPANQIVHVVLDKPTKRIRLMDTLWVTGVMSATQTDSHMGMASYRIDAKAVAPYREKK